MKISSKISDVMTKVSDSISARIFSYTFDMMFSWCCKKIIVDLMIQDLIYCLMIMMSQVTSNVVFIICRSMNAWLTFESIKQSSLRSQLTTISSSRWVSKWFFRESSHSKSLFSVKWFAWSRASLLSLKSLELLISREQNYFVLAARLEFDWWRLKSSRLFEILFIE